MIAELLHYLKAQEKRGITHVWLDEPSRAVLRNLHVAAKNHTAADAKKPSDGIGQKVTREAKSEPVAKKSPVAPVIEIIGSDKAEKIAALKKHFETWSKENRLESLRSVMVFSVGDVHSPVVFVGEAPGYEEEKKGEPFVGPAGQKLDDILKAMTFSRQKVYLTNVSKFRPAMPKQTTANRPPTTQEMALSMPFVQKEMEIIAPKCIVALGGSAAAGLLGLESVNVGALRETWHDFAGIPLRVTYHPSYLLRTQSAMTEKRKVWEDMLAVMELLEMPISEKQRGYFTAK